MMNGNVSLFSRELPAVAAVHALAEGRHRLVGGSGLGLRVGHFHELALAALHPAMEGQYFVGAGGTKICQTQRRPHASSTHDGARNEAWGLFRWWQICRC